METRGIVEVMAELVPENGNALARRYGPQALARARTIQVELLPHLEGNAAYAPLWQQFQDDPTTKAPVLDSILQVILAADAALAARLDALLAEYRKAVPARITSVDTGGGAYIGGSVSSDSFVGRDQIIHGDQVSGDKVAGDKVTGSKTQVGDISGSTGLAVGPQAQVTMAQTYGLGGDELARLFATVYQKIETRPEDPDVDKDEVAETVQKIEQEVSKGEQANPKKVERWLRFLAGMAGDIFDVTVSCLASPVAGIAAVIRNVAKRAKEEAG